MAPFYFYLAFPAFLGGVMMLWLSFEGLEMYWQGVASLVVGTLCVWLGIREREFMKTVEVIDHSREVVYTPEDFPCPDSKPGRKKHWAGYSGFYDPAPANDEIAFAVIIPHTSEPKELIAVGERLRDWQSSHDFGRRTVGLEHMLRGELPEVPSFDLWLSVPPPVEYVALVFVAPAADNEETVDSLIRVLDGTPIGIMSVAYYTQINR